MSFYSEKVCFRGRYVWVTGLPWTSLWHFGCCCIWALVLSFVIYSNNAQPVKIREIHVWSLIYCRCLVNYLLSSTIIVRCQENISKLQIGQIISQVSFQVFRWLLWKRKGNTFKSSSFFLSAGLRKPIHFLLRFT